MWIFTSNAFLSIVDKAPAKHDELLVRARRQGDIEAVFPNAKVMKTIGSDYLFRACVKRIDIAAAMVKMVNELNYDNFKDSIPMADKQLKHACHGVWDVMADTQEIPPYATKAQAKQLKKGKKAKGQLPMHWPSHSFSDDQDFDFDVFGMELDKVGE